MNIHFKRKYVISLCFQSPFFLNLKAHLWIQSVFLVYLCDSQPTGWEVRGAPRPEGGALWIWELVGGGGQSHCQELGSNSSPIPLAWCLWAEATKLSGWDVDMGLRAGPSIRPLFTELAGLMWAAALLRFIAGFKTHHIASIPSCSLEGTLHGWY